MKKIFALLVTLGLVLAACGPTADAPTPHVCYGDATRVYSTLDASQSPITLSGKVVGWIDFTNSNINVAEGSTGIPSPINQDPLVEGMEYTIQFQIRTTDTIGTVTLVGFVCGMTFYYYIVPAPGPFFIG